MNAKASADEATYYTVQVVKMNGELLDDMWVSVNRDNKEKVVSVNFVSCVENAISFDDIANAKSWCNTVRKLYPDDEFGVREVSIDF